MDGNELEKSTGNYGNSRVNATRHGILSRQKVLPWESREEYEEAYKALNREYEPQGPTEEHLVGEIAGIIWRKRRLWLAENATCRDQYRRALSHNHNTLELWNRASWMRGGSFKKKE